MVVRGVSSTAKYEPSALLTELEKQRIRAVRDTTTSTIAPSVAVKSSFTPSKPTLANPAIRAVNVLDSVYTQGQRILDLNCRALEEEQQNISQLCQENIGKLEEAAKRSQEAGVWDYLQKIGSAVLATISIFLGVSLTATAATFIGGALIGAGMVTLSNLVLTEAGFWDWVAAKLASNDEELEKKIRTLVPCMIGLMANGVQFLALGSLAIFGTLDLATQALLVGQVIANVASTTTAVGGQISQARVAWSQGALTDIQGKISTSRHEVELNTDNIENVMSRHSQAHRHAQKIIDLTIETRRQALHV